MGAIDIDPSAALASAAAGHRGAWESLVSAYAGLVWSVARSFRLSEADAADVFQGTWLRLVEHLGDIRDGSRLGGWLAMTARREALMLLRRNRSTVVTDAVEDVADVLLPGADAGLLQSEEQRTLWRAFEMMSIACQRLLRVAFGDPPLAYDEISAALNMPIGSIGPSRARCLAQLRMLLPDPAAD
ncbi:MAG TPA: sigma-70 family RNA polymerase sigma factor [Micromonosporaceae bacterium]